ncbi:MAG TPA: hypothetical protein VFZ67_10020 [Nitrososphaera sp.]
MTKRFDVATIESTSTIIDAKSLWKKVGYHFPNCDIYHNSRFKLYTIRKSIKKEEDISNAA